MDCSALHHLISPIEYPCALVGVWQLGLCRRNCSMGRGHRKSNVAAVYQQSDDRMDP